MDPRRLAAVRDWDWLIATARVHGVLPRLERLVRSTNGATPVAVRRELHARARESAARNLRLAGELLRIVDAFAERGIRVLAYKGPTLAVLAYGDLGLRAFRDLDIVVDPADVAAGRTLLEQLGYHTGPLDPPPSRRNAFLALGSEYPYFRDDGDIVELHWRLLPPYFAMRLPFDELWARRAAIPLGRRTVPTLSREDLALALCAHGAQHHWDRLAWIADIARLLHPDAGVDWHTASERAHRLGGTRMLGLAVRLATALFGIEPPIPCRPLIADRRVIALAAAVVAPLFRRPPTVEVDLRRRLFHLRAHERLRDRIAYLRYFLTIPNAADWAVVPLPRVLAPLYYLVRPVRLSAKYAIQLVRTLRGFNDRGR